MKNRLGPESPRWLIVKGRYKEAMEIIQLMADVNGREVPGWLDISRIKTASLILNISIIAFFIMNDKKKQQFSCSSWNLLQLPSICCTKKACAQFGYDFLSLLLSGRSVFPKYSQTLSRSIFSWNNIWPQKIVIKASMKI